MNNEIIDKTAMGLSGALMFLGIIGLGIVEILAGQPYGAAPVTNDAGEVVATPAIDPALRTGLVLLGIVVLLLWRLYKMAQPQIAGGAAKQPNLAGE
ncbi:hypothetical protein [Haloarchaeobius sp. HME9146]|uniref:hypothetical protein n=1 Tax=Haloarchaeobius sp. HME9146 TaxID=2978732 RepID=UPI0021BF5BEA|nr:hypothetical protein [Haloarchaeobius sp. HME9146]MCT9097044.1 hypothetical protein [Haloarchaeobius sp. HME9146]